MTQETLAAGEIQVWCLASEALSPAALAGLHDLLDPAKQLEIARLVFARDRALHTAAHGLLRLALSAVTGADPRAWRFGREPLGRLTLAAGQQGPSFNVTHTRGLAACALSWQPGIGVDAEFGRDGAAPLDIAPRVFTAAEQARLARLQGAARSAAFFDTWTLKEAVMKATGRGFDLSPSTLESTLAPPWVGGAIDGDWGFALLRPTPAHHLAVAQQGGGVERLRWRHLEGTWQGLPLNRRPAG